jgi:putative hydrolase of the HAD superfamily
VVGVTVLRDEADSPSFPRRITHEFTPPWQTAIEYAIWWDWDIGHLYELEHAWSYIDADGRLVWAEASWHGAYYAMTLAGGVLAAEGDRPLLYSQPGKHAFAPEQICMDRIVAVATEDAADSAGKGGVLVKERYAAALDLQEGDYERVAAHLRTKAFRPTMRFAQRFAIEREMLVPWPQLDAWIPARMNWWLAQLRAGV